MSQSEVEWLREQMEDVFFAEERYNLADDFEAAVRAEEQKRIAKNIRDAAGEADIIPVALAIECAEDPA